MKNETTMFETKTVDAMVRLANALVAAQPSGESWGAYTPHGSTRSKVQESRASREQIAAVAKSLNVAVKFENIKL